MQAKDELTRLQHKVLSSKDEAIQARDQTIAALEARLRDNNSLITMQGEIMRDRAFSMTVSETKGWTLNKYHDEMIPIDSRTKDAPDVAAKARARRLRAHGR